jgi:glycosyltransferase involved in cell wall biosynthesis
MYDEAANAERTLAAVADELASAGWDYELIPVDDGSRDGTGAKLAELASEDAHIIPVSYSVNRGRGYALRRGFDRAAGDLVASLDADLSYTPDHLVRMFEVLEGEPETDVVVGSPYMPGGSATGVPFFRHAVSRVGNAILRLALPQRIHTTTGILRAYRADVLRSVDLEADGKEIHLEILSKTLALGYRVVETPAVLRSRRRGSSSFRLSSTVVSHLLFGLLERSAVLFGLAGVALVLASVVLAAYMFVVFLRGELNPERPLMTVMILLFLGGQAGLSLAVLATMLLELRRSVVRLQRDVRALGRLER